MTKMEEIAKMLGLAEKQAESAPPADDVISVGHEDGERPAPPSNTVLQQDSWNMRKARELIDDPKNERIKAAQVDEDEVADFWNMSFEPLPKHEENPRDKDRRTFCEQLMGTSEYQDIHASTQLNELASTLAATNFAERWAKLREEEREKCERAEAEGESHEMSPSDCRSAVAAALSAAKEEVGGMEEACRGLGLGEGMNSAMDMKRVAALMKKINSSETLRRILKHAGRFRRVAMSKQRMKSGHGQDEVVGVVPDNDVSRLLPVELSRMMDPALEWDTLRRFAEKQTQCWETRGVVPAGRGPVIVTIDESGSMTGDPVETAKALCLALAWVARKQRRWICFVAYSGATGKRVLTFPSGQWSELEMAEWLSQFIGGGSDLDVPLKEIPELYDAVLHAPKGKTDLIIITDAIVHAPKKMAEDFAAWKKRANCKVFTMVIGQKTAGDLEHLSDHTYFVETIDADSDGVGDILSI